MNTFFVIWGKILIECQETRKCIRHNVVIGLHDISDKALLKKKSPHARWIKESQAPREVKTYIEHSNTLANDFGQDFEQTPL